MLQIKNKLLFLSCKFLYKQDPLKLVQYLNKEQQTQLYYWLTQNLYTFSNIIFFVTFQRVV